MSVSRIVTYHNNGVKAVMLWEDYQLLMTCTSNEEALEKGARWYIFMTFRRMAENPENLWGAPVGTYEDFDQVKATAVIYSPGNVSFYVPYSNGPWIYQDERKFIFPLTDLLYRMSK